MRGVLRTNRIIDAFFEVDRKLFVPKEYAEWAYDDRAIPLGYGAMISQPSVVAFMLELLNPKPGEKILDVGAGSGWTTALLAQIVKDTGAVIGTDIIPELVESCQIRTKGFLNTRIVLSKHGFPKSAPYDRILVSAAIDTIPEHLTAQLRVGGVMVIPIKQSLWRITRVDEQQWKKEEYPGFLFVPFVR